MGGMGAALGCCTWNSQVVAQYRHSLTYSLSTSLYLPIHIYVERDTYIRMYARMYVRMHVCMYASMHVRMYACKHVRMYACTHA